MDERLIFPTHKNSKSNGKNFQMTKIAQDFDHSTIRILHQLLENVYPLFLASYIE